MSNTGFVEFGQAALEGNPIFVRSFFAELLEEHDEGPPRLGLTDLQHPEDFHERLVAFLMRQH